MRYLFIISFILFSRLYLFSQCTHPDYNALMEFYNATNGSNWVNNTGWKEGAEGTNCEPCSWIGVECEENRVVSLLFSDNNLNGQLPNLQLPKLKKLILSRNHLNGSIPDFSYCPELEQFEVQLNQLSGEIPDFTNIPKVWDINVGGNKLYGTIPNFSNLPNLHTFICKYNQLIGEIPDFTSLPNLAVFDCSFNNIKGEIPDFNYLPKLDWFYCSNNQLTGEIPSFSHSLNLSSLRVYSNMLTGKLPDYSNHTRLFVFECNDNNLSGCYPEYICQIENFVAINNPLLPWIGNHVPYCSGESQVGAPCDDGNINTTGETIQPDCSCSKAKFCDLNSPILSLSFNGGNFNDESGYNNIVEKGNTPELTSDRFGNPNSAALFGGFYDQDWLRVKNSDILHFDKQMTVSLWFKQCSFAGMDGWGNFTSHGYHMLFSKAGDGVSAKPGIYSGTSTDINNLLHVNFNNVYGKDMNIDTTFTCFDTCEWVHYAVVVDSNSVKMYFNGRLKKKISCSIVNFNEANTLDFMVGRMDGGGRVWYPFNGIIDDILVYKCALSDESIKDLFGDYKDPLYDEQAIVLDEVKFQSFSCTDSLNNLLTISSDTSLHYQFSIDSGKTWTTKSQFKNLDSGYYLLSVRSSCGYLDTLIYCQINKSYSTTETVSICPNSTYTLPDGTQVSTAGTYIDTLATLSGCDSIITTNLTVLDEASHHYNFTIVANPDGKVPLGSELTLTISNPLSGVTYNWYANGLSIGTNSPEITTIVSDTHTVYSVEITNNLDSICTATGEIAIDAFTPTIRIPNAFTPNNDNRNDRFRAVIDPGIEIVEMVIVSRWGEVMYSASGNEGWDGRYKNQEAPADTYLFRIRYKFIVSGDVKEEKGEVNLFR
ncbi:MAG TPA: gliding motility-associated C-terminal domain-containing protein [Saprospiraceae bacterium]|jgi:gliding motility-associated-like protein|nr:gliding motility-associated C-terminal domain-containing protein [Saprospiraceae bacterium]HQW94355.1 gliding motility-associated C-terminal domain-containing protein [Saprospiraceae bacterium]